MLAIVLSLGAALAFSLAAMLINTLAGRVTVFQLARWQMSMAFVLTALASLALGGWATVAPWQFWFLAASSVIGIMLASTTYFAAIYAAGPRLTALLFSLAAPFAVIEGWLFLDEALSLGQLSGIGLILGGIVLAIVAAGDTHPDDAPRRPLWQGVMLGVITALGQATGSLLARPAMEAGVEPLTAMAIRSGLGAAFFIALMVFPFARAARLPTGSELRTVGWSAFFGMFLGMSLMMAALSSGDVGIVSTLTSTTPILILPMLWFTTRRAPTPGAWAGAVLAVAGTALISMAA
ncbi:DMT family transporter [Tabrizicola sp.]|uniref:DMT family transporter n=1 Tax=Tabrizicola sp. TaxID=2005166 RepID=UPI003D29E3A0